MAKQSVAEDRNFDDLAARFKKNVYGGLKGAIRLAVLQRDFAQQLPFVVFDRAANPADSNLENTSSKQNLRILDAGGGQGQFSLLLAEAGHQVVLCDISTEMLKLAETEIIARNLSQVSLIHCAIQDLPQHRADCQFDLVLCHAVMEWMAEPQTLLPCLNQYLKPDGYLSLTYYNIHSLIYKNLLRTNFKKVIEQDFIGWRGSLTPINPIDPVKVNEWLAALPFELLSTSGIRVFHDYIFDVQQRDQNPKDLIALELQFSQQEPYRSLGRYMHVLAKKSGD